MIRWLKSDRMKDFWEEIRLTGAKVSETSVYQNLNPSFTFKFSELSLQMATRLEDMVATEKYLIWPGEENGQKSVIISFPNMESVRTFLSDRHGLEPLRRELASVLEHAAVRQWEFPIPQGTLRIDPPLVMGVLNVTPDSFSDGGDYFDPGAAVHRALEMEETGASIIDIGAESTRPGARPVAPEEEWQRLQPVLKEVCRRSSIPISIDTYKSEIARRALQEGASLINDISGLVFDSRMAGVAAEAGVPVVVMHIKGTPRDMQKNPFYRNVMETLFLFLRNRLEFARQQGIEQVIVDPGIGFGKRWEDNFEIIRRLEEFRVLGCPILVGPSRKSFIGKALDVPPKDRLIGTAAAAAMAISKGASIIRVHDVKEMVQVCTVVRAVQNLKAG